MRTDSWIIDEVIAAPRFPINVRLRYMPAAYVAPVKAPSPIVNKLTVQSPLDKIIDVTKAAPVR